MDRNDVTLGALLSNKADPHASCLNGSAPGICDNKRLNVTRGTEIPFEKWLQSLRCTDGPSNWPSLSHEMTS